MSSRRKFEFSLIRNMAKGRRVDGAQFSLSKSWSWTLWTNFVCFISRSFIAFATCDLDCVQFGNPRRKRKSCSCARLSKDETRYCQHTVSVCPVLISLSTKGSAWLFSNTTPVRCPYWSCALSIYFYIRAVNLAAPIPFSGKGIAITRKEKKKKAAAANAISLEIKVVGSRWFHNQRTASGLDVLSRSFQKALILIVRWSHAPIQSTHVLGHTTSVKGYTPQEPKGPPFFF